jgi:hypothetical protein
MTRHSAAVSLELYTCLTPFSVSLVESLVSFLPRFVGPVYTAPKSASFPCRIIDAVLDDLPGESPSVL